jgi:hypothetical protein
MKEPFNDLGVSHCARVDEEVTVLCVTSVALSTHHQAAKKMRFDAL